MPSFNYIDKHPQWTKTGDWYTSTNELVPQNLKVIDQYIAPGKDHIASICSGGDFPIMMIHLTKQSMQVVDHAKKSMVWAMLKVILLEQLGAERCRKLLTGPWEDFDAAAKPLLTLLPGDIASCYYNATTSYYDKGWSGIVSVWEQLNLNDLAAAVHHLHKITFIHGDFNLDLVPPEGGFDAAYVSNMCGHQNRDRVMPDMEDTINKVKIGAPLLGACCSSNPRIKSLCPYLAYVRVT